MLEPLDVKPSSRALVKTFACASRALLAACLDDDTVALVGRQGNVRRALEHMAIANLLTVTGFRVVWSQSTFWQIHARLLRLRGVQDCDVKAICSGAGVQLRPGFIRMARPLTWRAPRAAGEI